MKVIRKINNIYEKYLLVLFFEKIENNHRKLELYASFNNWNPHYVFMLVCRTKKIIVSRSKSRIRDVRKSVG